MRKGQVTIFVIVAIVIVALIGVFIAFRGNLFGDNIPASLQPVYSRYSECINEEVNIGIKLLSSQGGRIDIGELGYASDFNPFSTHLNFLGLKIPYWYGFSENNLIINNVPSVNDMEKDLEDFISERISDCDFSDFYAKGFSIEDSEAEASVDIQDNVVSVTVDSSLTVALGDDTARKISHDVSIDSKLGSLYNNAVSIYNSERQNLFFENYALDVLQSYAPVDGVEIQCSPKIWKTNDVVNDVQNGLNANIGNIGFSGDSSKEDYFSQNLGINEPVNIMYLPQAFPSKIEVSPASQTIMVAEPVGTQQGMGVMGFCYVPYHFVYDLRFPVLVQIGDGIDNFQFPMVVDIDNNLVNGGDFTPISDEPEVDVCAFAENTLTVNTYDNGLNPISANVSYKCFDSLCNLGQSENGVLDAKVPACVNGEIVVNAEGYAESKVLFSSNSESFAEIVLEREYSLDVAVMLGNRRVDRAVIHFVGSDGYSASAILPESPIVKLKEGLYNIQAYVYGNSSIVIPSTTKTECFQTTRGGIAGFFGSKTERCVNVEIPSTKIDYALLGGGKLTEYYLLASELETGKVTVEVSELPSPNSLEQLQYNYEVFDTLGLEVSF